MSEKDNKVKEEETPEEVASAEEKTEKKPEEKPNKETKKEKKQTKKEKELQEKLDELNDKYMRLLAEYDNFRKRSVKEREETYSIAYADAAEQLLKTRKCPKLSRIQRR